MIKRKLMPVLASAIALSIAAMPVAVKAQSAPATTPSSSSVAPLVNQLFPLLNGVQLTLEQRAQLAVLGADALSKAQAVVTPAQLTSFRQALAQGKDFPEALAAMNVSLAQVNQLGGIFLSVQQQVITSLTPAQKQQILTNVRSLLRI